MKKKVLFTSLLFSATLIAAGTAGSVEVYNANETVYASKTDFNESFRTTKSTLGVKTEVKVKNAGLSFGTDVKVKDYKLFESASELTKVLGNVKSNSSVWAKYELPEMNSINSYVKAKYETKGKINVEGDLSYKLAEKLSAGLNSETIFDFSNETIGLTQDTILSTHKAYLKGEYKEVKNIDVQLGVKHSYDKNIAAKNVFLNAKASYESLENLKITGAFDFKYAFNPVVGLGEKPMLMKDDSLLLREFKLVKKDKLIGKYRHSYLLTANYKGIKNTELKLDSFIEHALIKEDTSILNFGFKPEVTYKGIPNLVLSSKNIFGGNAFYDEGDETVVTGYIKLNGNVEYAYNITDKFLVKPSMDLTSEFVVNTEATQTALLITPKLKVEYKPIENLMISGDISSEFSLAGDSRTKMGLGYVAATVKSSVNVKYTW